MSDTPEEHPLEIYGDTHTDASIAQEMANMSDLALGKIAGVASVLQGKECSTAKEANHETDGSCRVYNAALNEYDKRSR